MMTKMRRFLYWAPVSLLLFTLAASFVHPHPAYAAATGEFQDASTIKVGELVYFDSKFDSDFTYTLQGGNSSCAKITRDKGNTSSGTIYVASTTNVGSCDKQPITFTHSERSQWTFVWSSATAITTSDQRRIYDQSSQDNTTFIETSDQVTNGQGCQDSIVTSDPSSTSATLFVRAPNLPGMSGGPNVSSYPLDILKSASYIGKQSGCYTFKTSVNIAPYQDPSATGALTHGATTGGAGAGAHDSNATCEASGFTLNWLLCAVYNGVADFSDWVFTHLVQPLLRTSPVSTDPSDTSYKIWSSFRVYGDIFLVIALLVVVFGQAIGGGLIDAYTAKKVLPRLLAAAILINLSVYIVAAMVDLINIVGAGIGNLITAPLKDAGAFNVVFHPGQQATIIGATTITGALGAIAIGVGAIPPLSFILLFLVMPVVFGLLAAFIVLVLRQAIILALILVSPIAFALYCLPNTEKYFRKWWEWLFEWLSVYPIVIIIFAVADVLSVTVMKANNSNNPLAAIISFALQFLPLLLIPFAIRIAGGTVSRLHEVLGGSQKRMQEAIKGNPNNPFSLRNKAKLKYRSNMIAGGSGRLSSLRETSKTGGVIRRRLAVGQMRAMQSAYDWDRGRSDMNKTFDEAISGKVATGSDTLERAFFARQWTGPDTTYTDSAGNTQTLKSGRYYSTYRNSQGVYQESSEGDVKASHSLYDGNESMIQTLIKYETGKVSNDEDFYGVDATGKTIYDPSLLHKPADEGGIDKTKMPLGSFLGNLPAVMKEAKLSSTSASGASIGSFFATQAQRKELKHTRLDVQKDGSWVWKQDVPAYVQDWAENMGMYAGTNSKTSPIKRLTSVYEELQARDEASWTPAEKRTMDDLESIARAYDTRMRTGQQIGATEDGTPIMGGAGGSGAAGRVNDAVSELVRTVLGSASGGSRPARPRPPSPEDNRREGYL